MVPNRVPASGKRSRGLSGQAKCPPLHSFCVWDAGRSPTHILLTIPLQPFGPAWVTCMSSASQQPCGGVSQGRGCLCPLTAWQCQGRRGCREVGGTSQPPGLWSCPPTQVPPGVCCRGLGWDRWYRAGALWSGPSLLLQPC